MSFLCFFAQAGTLFFAARDLVPYMFSLASQLTFWTFLWCEQQNKKSVPAWAKKQRKNTNNRKRYDIPLSNKTAQTRKKTKKCSHARYHKNVHNASFDTNENMYGTSLRASRKKNRKKSSGLGREAKKRSHQQPKATSCRFRSKTAHTRKKEK